MKLRLRRYETWETLEFEVADTTSLHHLQRRIYSATPPSSFRSLGIEIIASAESKRLSEPFFLKKAILEKSGDPSDLTTLATSVHAVMLESGFIWLNNHHGGCFDKFSFSKELLAVSLMYTLPELITKTTIEYVTIRFQRLNRSLVVYGSLSGSMVKRVSLDKYRFTSVIDLVVDTLKFEKQAFCSSYRDLFVFWRMVKDGLCIPLLMALCDKYGLEPPPCLMGLPTELKMRILELVPGDSVAKMACVCMEMRCLALDDDLWKQKCLEEDMHLAVGVFSVSWKATFASLWRQRQEIRRSSRRDTETHSPVINRDPRAYRFNRRQGFIRER